MKSIYKNFRLIIFSVVLMITSTLWAQEVQPTNAGNTSGFLTADITQIIVLSVTVFVLLIVLYMLYVLKVFLSEMNAKKEIKTKPLFDLTAAIPMERENEILMDHDYDGIRELDNNLPPWWVYMFYATIIFGVFYIWYYHIDGSGNLQTKEYEVELAQAEVQMKLAANKVDENSVKALTDKARLVKGAEIYQANCAPCHGKQGEGKVGPNLTDAYWIHGGNIQSIFKTIKYGIPEKGMISWQSQLGPSQIQEVSSYLLTLKGTNPPNAKAPQGNKE